MTATIDQDTESTTTREGIEELGAYGSLKEAGDVVDRLAAAGIPSGDLRIVGGDLQIVTRAGGRSRNLRAAGQGALAGLWFGLLLGVLFMLFAPVLPMAVLVSMLVCAFGGAVFGFVAPMFAEGTRAAAEQVVARQFTVLVRGPHAARAREILEA